MGKEGVLWVGGSSGLALTFMQEVAWSYLQSQERCLVLTGHEAPEWLDEARLKFKDRIVFAKLDLLSKESVEAFFHSLARFPCKVTTCVFGIRLSLVHGGKNHVHIIPNVKSFLKELLQLDNSHVKIIRLLHLSSVAVVDHLQAQHLITEDAPLPMLQQYNGPYDIFKRSCEEIIEDLCTQYKLPHSNLRLSGIFSNDKNCIQMGAMELQSIVTHRSPNLLDMNTSYNVSLAILLLLGKLQSNPSAVKRVYYYTRDTIEPKEYISYLLLYREVHNIWYGVCLPHSLCALAFSLFHFIAFVIGSLSSSIQSLSYLLRVGQLDHTFDNNRFRTDFPEIADQEETIREGFVRIESRRKQKGYFTHID
eukprot:m.23335 g.23335  ORF g.23335 m.23335 type:complete len:364 (+) comp7490_c0_seq2:267-1358(+)